MSTRGKSFGAPIAALAALLILLPAYLGTYYAAIENQAVDVGRGEHQYRIFGPPQYHVGGDAAAAFFYPAHLADRHVIRADMWFDIHYSQSSGGLW